ncbi:response regulator transcription factor [Nocardioides bigeumensis]|uniref:Response regulator transcription factor n=1 Tax=Nocardioides bigeumensis TaxID=433657 RepID=A0ABN2XUW0_9ACTN
MSETQAPSGASAAQQRALIVDDHELVRHGLATVFEAHGFDVVGQAGTVAEALAIFERTTPDAVVTDLQLPDGTGLDIVRAVRRSHASTGLVIVTMHSGDEQIFAAMEAGASAFVGKDAPSTEVVQAARHAIASPRSFMSTGLVGAVMRRTDTTSSRLSDREMEVLVLLADGLGTSSIASRLYMSDSTVKSHIAQIYTKLGASNRAQALVTAMRRGLLSTIAPPHS